MKEVLLSLGSSCFVRTAHPFIFGSNLDYASIMTLDRAFQIEQALIYCLQNQTRIADVFEPLSKTGVADKRDIFLSQQLCIAKKYEDLVRRCAKPTKATEFDQFVQKEQWKSFNEYLKAVSEVRMKVYLYFIPDEELVTLIKLQHSHTDPARAQEWNRVSKLHDTDGSMDRIETVESFVRFLRTIDPTSPNYYAQVYERIGLPYPPQSPATDRPKEDVKAGAPQGCAASILATVVLVFIALLMIALQ